MARPSLQDIDTSFAEQPGPRPVPRLNPRTGGVDPLGLRQINLDLMDEALPGINNVTRLIRPYSVMAWAWWKAGELARARGGNVKLEDLQAFVARADVIFVWSQFLIGAGEELPGRQVLGKLVLDRDHFRFSGKAWEEAAEMRRTSTGLMAPVQYGPSIGSDSGIGFLARHLDSGGFVPVEAVMPAIAAVERKVVAVLPHALRELNHTAITSDEVKKISKAWHVMDETEAERRVFRQRFYGSGINIAGERLTKRRGTVDLMLAALRSGKAPMDTDALRLRMFQGPTAFRAGEIMNEEMDRALMIWRVLQVRQLQRLTIESLFAFVEYRIGAASRATSRALAEAAERLARKDLREVPMQTVGGAIDALNKASNETATGKHLFALMDAINAAQLDGEPARLPGLALQAFALVARAVRGLSAIDGAKRYLRGATDRLPLKDFIERLDALHTASFDVFWREVIEAWVLGQHVRWAVARNGDETQRLRVALDEGGWVRLRARQSGFAPTPDRLHAALCLAERCDLVSESDGKWTAAV